MLISATRRLTDIVVNEKIADPLRNAAFAADPRMNHVGYLVTCERCTSVWAGGLMATLAALAIQRRSTLPLIPIAALALSQYTINATTVEADRPHF
jgi:hypothetical protein